MGKKPREDPYLVKQREEVTEKVLDDDEKLMKGRRYISDPSEAPEGANVQRGPQGGYWYDTGSVEGGGDGGGEAPSGGGDGGSPSLTYDDLSDPSVMEFPERNIETEMGSDAVDEFADRVYREGNEDIVEVYGDIMGMDIQEAAEDLANTFGMSDLVNPEDYSGGDGGGDGAPGGMDEDYWNVIESDEGREIASTIIEELGDVGVEYVEEALHQDGSYFDTQFDSVEEALEDAQLYAEF